MRIILATVLIALLTIIVALNVPSRAQPSSKGLAGEMSKTQHGGAKKQVDDKDYKSTLDRMPDQKYDPWRNIR